SANHDTASTRFVSACVVTAVVLLASASASPCAWVPLAVTPRVSAMSRSVVLARHVVAPDDDHPVHPLRHPHPRLHHPLIRPHTQTRPELHPRQHDIHVHRDPLDPLVDDNRGQRAPVVQHHPSPASHPLGMALPPRRGLHP